MLEAGVSSSLEIARFWGIAGEAAHPRESEVAASVTASASAPHRPSPQPSTAPAKGVGDQVMATVSRHVPGAVQDIIAGALRTAGLMK
jgi:hypothetical protein